MRISCNSWLSYALVGILILTFFGCGSDKADSKFMSSKGGDAFPAEERGAESTFDNVASALPEGPNFAGETGQEPAGVAMSIDEPESESFLDIDSFPETAAPKRAIIKPPTIPRPKMASPRNAPGEPIAKRTSDPAPMTDPMTEPIIEPIVEPIVEPKMSPIIEPIVEPIIVPKHVAESTPQFPEKNTEETPAASKRRADGMNEVNVFYGTDRNRMLISKASVMPLKIGMFGAVSLLVGAILLLVFNRLKSSLVIASVAGVVFLSLGWYQKQAPTRDGITYGVQRGTFVRGIATVTVPDSHRRGLVERPSILRLEFSEDEKKHIILAKATEMESDEFYQRMSEQVRGSSDQDLMVFVHGYNIDFDSAVRRTAQIATDLSFQGVPVCYSWPSQGSLIGYTVDENNVIWTVPHLRDFLLELVTQSQAKSINIIAHSMGNRAVTSSLGQISNQFADHHLPIFDEIVLAAPDVDADHFRNELAPQLAAVGKRVTLYASSDDQALAASKHLHGGYPRAGESGENLVVVPDVETIDVSGIDLSLLGHSYYGNSESILKDLFDVVRNRLPPGQRSGLVAKQLMDSTYWMLPRPQLSELNDTPVR